MNVVRLRDSEKNLLVQGTAPKPAPGPGEVLIRVYAAGVTPSELLWYPTTHTREGGHRIGAIPGHEFSGVIEAVGAGIDSAQVGREVYGMNDWFADGASADYCLSAATSVTAKPSRLSHVEAASVPISALTAWQGLFDRAKLQAGERVLIHGGPGAVGLYVIQLARRAGAHVITTASSRNFDFLATLGANELIDYRTDRFEEKVRDLDVIFDTVGGETLHRSWDLLKPTGRLVTIAAQSEGTKDQRVEKAFFIVEPNQEHLAEIARLFDANELQCFVDSVVSLTRAPEAYTGTVKGGRGRGKVVLSIAS